ncbi:hypothetical protein [Acinetobacter sp. Marseille-Q1618]|uniref:hypothetical protein n=1 Tax=Acinetobacter sp. Marseille-Q1618 TaxID=2697502 RepID=UPI001570A651|nr:hypothetical protein [Acinetobacter sp. Marseille-Q1618]
MKTLLITLGLSILSLNVYANTNYESNFKRIINSSCGEENYGESLNCYAKQQKQFNDLANDIRGKNPPSSKIPEWNRAVKNINNLYLLCEKISKIENPMAGAFSTTNSEGCKSDVLAITPYKSYQIFKK